MTGLSNRHDVIAYAICFWGSVAPPLSNCGPSQGSNSHTPAPNPRTARHASTSLELTLQRLGPFLTLSEAGTSLATHRAKPQRAFVNRCHCDTASQALPGAGSNCSASPFMQYRRSVGGGPSRNTCPRCPWHALHLTCVPRQGQTVRLQGQMRCNKRPCCTAVHH